MKLCEENLKWNIFVFFLKWKVNRTPLRDWKDAENDLEEHCAGFTYFTLAFFFFLKEIHIQGNNLKLFMCSIMRLYSSKKIIFLFHEIMATHWNVTSLNHILFQFSERR